MPATSDANSDRSAGSLGRPAVSHAPGRGRRSIAACLLVWALLTPLTAWAVEALGYDTFIHEAEALAQKPFEPPKPLAEELSKMSYDQWRNIRFKPETGLWRGDELPFEIQFFHPGWLYNHPVALEVAKAGAITPLAFSPEQFHYGLNAFKDKLPKDLGFAGFRIHAPIKTGKYFDEVAVFLGASYFRAVGSDQNYGLSARGLALDTALDSGEEFPSFTRFRLMQPDRKAKAMTVLALLDSPSATGAYRFVITPGKTTQMEVKATLFFRREVKKLGLAPLGSMFFFGENTNIRPVNDFRPEIHDSDGLQILTATGEWIWRPLINPKWLLVTSFQQENPKGFGLLQRDHDFDHYQDLEASYQLRPSGWIMPDQDWGKGRIELVQIPTDSEMNDNVVAYWVPESPARPGTDLSLSYRIFWGSAETPASPLARVAATRTATDGREGKLYLIDFQGGKLGSLGEKAALEADISAGGGEVAEHHLQRITPSGGWRLVFRIRKKAGALDTVLPNRGQPVELRAFLRQGDEVLSETWSYVDPF